MRKCPIDSPALRTMDAGSNTTSGPTIAPSAALNILTLASTNALFIGQAPCEDEEERDLIRKIW
jgi:hypothetical protein